jgi:tetratricopeptide (TPR) repeat protein
MDRIWNGENVRTLWLLLAAILVLSGGIAGTTSANASAQKNEVADDVADELRRAIAAAESGRCDQAFELLSGAENLASRARLLAAQCRIRSGLYHEALSDLNRIRGASDLTPSQVGDVEVFRAVAFYHLERYTEAAAALGRAKGLTSEEAQVSLYTGLIALRNGDNDRAAAALESAVRLAPAITEPVASYYAGLAWQGSAERAKARAAFRRVIELDGDGPWGKEAAKMLAGNAAYPFYVNLHAGIEFNSNVELRGKGLANFFPGFEADDSKADGGAVWQIDAGVELFEKNDWSGGVNAGYTGNAHFDRTDFDMHYLTSGGYVTRQFDAKNSALLQYQFGFAWVDEEWFLTTHYAQLGFLHSWSKTGTTRIVGDAIWSDIRFDTVDAPDASVCLAGTPPVGCGPNGVREDQERNRDGVNVGLGLSHVYPVATPDRLDGIVRQMDLVGGYRFGYNHSKGDEWKYFGHTFNVGMNVELPMAFRVGTHLQYEYRDFSNPSTFPDAETAGVIFTLSSADRQEHEVSLTTEIEKNFTKRLSASVRWRFVSSMSNRRLYDYTRHVVGAYLNYQFD